MHTDDSKVAYYLNRFRECESDEAFHGLLDLGPDAIPSMITAFRIETDARLRALLVEVIWQFRQKSAISFLGEALFDSESKVWRKALDGLVTLASPEALQMLRVASSRRIQNAAAKTEFNLWANEAANQIRAEMEQKNSRPN